MTIDQLQRRARKRFQRDVRYVVFFLAAALLTALVAVRQ